MICIDPNKKMIEKGKAKLINYKIIFPVLLLVIGSLISFGLTKVYGPRFAFLSTGIPLSLNRRSMSI